ncbi:MAG TPA: hypothetical protein VGJ13_20790 [Pseudonocardiaceae bacterium]
MPLVHNADTAVRALAASDSCRHGVGTTLTAMLFSGPRLALVHVGDSRIIRSGRSCSGPCTGAPTLNRMCSCDAQAGDRYLLCSDGLHTVLTVETLHEVMRTGPEPEHACAGSSTWPITQAARTTSPGSLPTS